MRAPGRLMEATMLVAAAAILAAIVHLVVVLVTPRIAAHDAFARLASLGQVNETVALPPAGPGEPFPPYADPAVAMAFCRYDLAAGPIRIRAPIGRAFSSISFHTRRGLAFYALTDRAGAHGTMDAVLATPDDVRALNARDDEESPSRDLRIAAPDREGYVVIRVFSETTTLYSDAVADAKRMTCAPEPVPR
jgi:uncharacterized membrane protein